MAFAFRLNPKQAVEQKARSLFGRDAKIKVLGRRLTPLESKAMGVPSASYAVEVLVNTKSCGIAYHRNWRKAYPLLNIELEKAYEASLTQV